MEDKPDQELRTKHGRLIARILGKTNEVMQFDSVRFTIKSSTKSQAAKLANEHDTLLAELQRAVQAEKTAIMIKIRTLETEHFKCHNNLPSQKNQTYQEMTHQYSLAQRLLATWKIQF